MSRRLLPIAAALACTWPHVAIAQEPAPAPEPAEAVDLTEPAPAPAPVSDESWVDAAPERRCGFMLSLGLGPIVGTARGYPNDSLKIDREEFHTKTGFGYGGQLGLVIGIALSDWFVIGVGPTFGRLNASDHVTGFGSVAFHIDAFPAFFAGGAWRDLGISVDAGLGLLEATDAEDSTEVFIESGLGSRLAIGAVWEGVQVWKLSMGPYVSADMMWSPSAFRPMAWAGWRTTFYGGP